LGFGDPGQNFHAVTFIQKPLELISMKFLCHVERSAATKCKA
jgi:hypothetical protein